MSAKYYKVTEFLMNGSKREFPSTDGGRYTGASPIIAAKKAGRVAARKFGAGTYHMEIYETTRGSRNNSHKYKIEAKKNTSRKPLSTINSKEGAIEIKPAKCKVTVIAE